MTDLVKLKEAMESARRDMERVRVETEAARIHAARHYMAMREDYMFALFENERQEDD